MDWFLGASLGLLLIGAGVCWLIYRDFQATRRAERRDDRRERPTPH